MKLSAAGVFVVGALAATGARAQIIEMSQFNQPIVAVTGEGEASRPADYGTLGFSYRGEGKSQVDALRALTTMRDRVENGLNNLKGSTGIKIEPGRFSVQELWSKGCDARGERIAIGEYSPSPAASRGGCVVEGYIATSTQSAQVSPAEVSGNAASLAAELGAVEVNLEGGGVSNPVALEQSAAKAALANAQAKAEAIAAAAGFQLGPVVRILDQRSGTDGRYREYSDQAIVVGLRRPGAPTSPTVRLDLPPPPIKRNAQMSVIYSIQR